MANNNPSPSTRFKPGQSGNPSGRPKNSLKSYVAAKLASMTPEEKEAFLKNVSFDLIWKMGEGNPTNEFTGGDGKELFPESNPKLEKIMKAAVEAQKHGIDPRPE